VTPKGINQGDKMENFDELVRKQSEYKNVREDKYRQESRDRLSKILKKKVETTMIGALSSIEDHFSFLWSSDGGLSPEQKIMYDVFQKVRSEILDKGNTQARNIDAELAQYDVKWLRYQATLPIQTRQTGDSNDQE
jgi:transcription termination factor Rho